MDEVILLESGTLRSQLCTDKNTELLGRVGKLILLPGTSWTTVKNMAKFFIVGESTIEMVVKRHKPELLSDGHKVLKRKDFENPHDVGFEIPNRGIAIFPRRAVLRIGMVLRNSPVAQLLRTYLLNAESSLKTYDRGTLIKMADQLTQHSIQISKNVGELKELAEVSINQSRIISAVVGEVYRNRDEIQEMRNIIKQRDYKVDFLDQRVEVLEKSLPLEQSSGESISKKQAETLKARVKAKNVPSMSIWAKFKKHFEVTRYIHLPESRYLEAVTWLDSHF